MQWASVPAIFFTVVLLVTTAYFLMGGLPLLILQHDTPVDGHFVRRFFEIYYRAAQVGALGAGISYALWGRWAFAAGAAAVALAAVLLQRRLVPAMQALGERIQAQDGAAIAMFRRLHSTALLLNLVLLVAIVWGITQVSL